MQSWPITTTFAIISVDLWAPGDMENYRGRNHLINYVYDMTQFLVSIATYFITASHLVRLFMKGVLSKFGLCAMIVEDKDGKFMGTFLQMGKALGIRVHVAAACNHETVGVEPFHNFLNHSNKVYGVEHQMSEICVEVAMVSVYAWNARTIDGTDIIRSVPTIGRELKYPMDIHITKIPQVIDSASQNIIYYL